MSSTVSVRRFTQDTGHDEREPTKENPIPAVQFYAGDVQLEAPEASARAEIRHGAGDPVLGGCRSCVLRDLSSDVIPQGRDSAVSLSTLFQQTSSDLENVPVLWAGQASLAAIRVAETAAELLQGYFALAGSSDFPRGGQI